MLGMVLIVGAAFKVVLNSNDLLRTENSTLKSENRVQNARAECRSRAAVFTETTDILADSLFAQSLLAAVDPAQPDLAPWRVALTAANRNRDVAIAARLQAIKQCTEDSAYNIPDNILLEVPPVPVLTS